MADIKAAYPNEIELEPIPNWTHIDPMEEAVDLMGGDESKVISVQL